MAIDQSRNEGVMLVAAEIGSRLDAGDLDGLFGQLGWDNPLSWEPVHIPESELRPVAVRHKRGVTVWKILCPDGIPSRSEQRRVLKELRVHSRDHLLVFVSDERQLWLWPEQRQSGNGWRLVDYEYTGGRLNTSLLQRLRKVAFEIDEEETLTASSVLDRVRMSFNSERVTSRFYKEFKKHHQDLVSRINGIDNYSDRRLYASLLLNRLMFIYFIQQKGFLSGDSHYLRNRLPRMSGGDQDTISDYFRGFLLPLFHTGLGSANNNYDSTAIAELIGKTPYVNGGIFEPHPIEKVAQHRLEVDESYFEGLFDFFDKWRWHLDERPTGEDNEINPDILGFIFEQYINYTAKGQRNSGAYYTKPDVTSYMAGSAIIPAVADRLVEAGLDDPCVLLTNSGERYINDAVVFGSDKPIPDDPPSMETPDASLDVALPGERWCDVVHRRERLTRLKKMLSDPDREWEINDAITENLDMATLLEDYLSMLGSLTECETAFDVLRSLTVCDPTVGSGAFLFAALDVLDPLYTTVFERASELAQAEKSLELANEKCMCVCVCVCVAKKATSRSSCKKLTHTPVAATGFSRPYV